MYCIAITGLSRRTLQLYSREQGTALYFCHLMLLEDPLIEAYQPRKQP